jgi:hypothetical protein
VFGASINNNITCKSGSCREYCVRGHDPLLHLSKILE